MAPSRSLFCVLWRQATKSGTSLRAAWKDLDTCEATSPSFVPDAGGSGCDMSMEPVTKKRVSSLYALPVFTTLPSRYSSVRSVVASRRAVSPSGALSQLKPEASRFAQTVVFAITASCFTLTSEAMRCRTSSDAWGPSPFSLPRNGTTMRRGTSSPARCAASEPSGASAAAATSTATSEH